MCVGVASTDGQSFLSGLWEKCGDMLEDQSQRIQASEFVLRAIKRPPLLGVVIQLPEPRGLTEVHLVFAFVTLRKSLFGGPKVDKAFFFTLEKTDSREEVATCLCAWTSERTHLNYGVGCEPEIDAFVSLCLAQAKLSD